MIKPNINQIHQQEYSLVGKNAALAVQNGLAEAQWYTPPIAREKLRLLLERRDGPAVRDTLLWFALLLISGVCGYLLWGTVWAAIPFAVYGVLYASSSDSRWHETSHGTAFKTDWMNNALYELASFMVLRESVRWRWSHTRHHSDTIIAGRDPEIAVKRPVDRLNVFLLNFLDIAALRLYASSMALHLFGRLTPEERTFIPASEQPKLFLRARIYFLIYAALVAFAVYSGSLLPLMYVGLPNLYGSWLMVIYGYTQHAGLAENVLDHRLNTRTVYMNRLNRFLYWNMGYHLEHHLFPLVPYHALPRLHALIKEYLPTPYNGLLETYREIIPALLRQSTDPAYYVKRQLPAAAKTTASIPDQAAGLRRIVDGWLEVCESGLLQNESVLGFDYERASYAIYRLAEGRLYATDGICTHGNARLADGFVQGTLIECAKHNGRFDVRDGSPQRLPACVGLKTYPAREADGKIWIDLRLAGGYAVTHPAVAHTFRVVANRHIATFIKELVLEPLAGAALPHYQPGDYLQIDIPAYPLRSLRHVEVPQPYRDIWQTRGIFDLPAANPAPCRRNYSLAGNPAAEPDLRFNVRLALPPPGVICNAGAGSAYLFSLRPGEQVTAIGPFGQFHVTESARERIYLGGGSGMAPLRSHLAWLIETRKTTTPIGYWFGARSLHDLFYQDYFEKLARENANFQYHAALSEPQPEDHWNGLTGFIHEVLQREYLSSHPAPRSIDYYLCGPPAMIRAANRMLLDLGVDPAQIMFDEF